MLKILCCTLLMALTVSVGASFTSSAASVGDYLIGPGDVLRVTVYDNPDLETVARVSTDGTIQFPLIGTVLMSDLTVDKASAKIESLLADGYLVNPQVTLFIEEYRSKKVVVIGHVKTPGVYKMQGPTSLLELISLTGGLKEDAGDMITINRQTEDGGTRVIRVDLQKVLTSGAEDKDVPIYDKDNIFVAKAGMVYVTGEVRSPAAYKLEEGTTVLKAITMAGGLTKLAADGRIRIVRIVDGEEIVLEKVSLQEPLQPEDVLIVPESFF